MRRPRLVVACVLLIVGLVWIGQGTGVVGGSAMTGSSFWAIVGGVMVIGGVAIGILELTRGRAGRP